jgi:hypothetical protein
MLLRLQPGAGPPGGGKGLFGAGPSNQRPVHEVRLEMGQLSDDKDYYAATEENQAFQTEFDQRKVKQDQVLDEIERGLGNLQNIATDVGGELNKQDILLDEMDDRVRSLLHDWFPVLPQAACIVIFTFLWSPRGSRLCRTCPAPTGLICPTSTTV